MKRIWKYKMRVADEQVVNLPKGAKILSVGVHRDFYPDGTVENERPCLWALVEPTADGDEARAIAMRGTGHPADGMEDATFLGTIFMFGGRLVFHVFEIGGSHPEEADR